MLIHTHLYTVTLAEFLCSQPNNTNIAGTGPITERKTFKYLREGLVINYIHNADRKVKGGTQNVIYISVVMYFLIGVTISHPF